MASAGVGGSSGAWEAICLGEGGGEVFGGGGAAVEVALTDVAAEPEEHVGVVLVFDAFGYGEQAETVAEADDGGGDLAALTGEGHGADEAGVDLDLVEGKGLELAEAGVADAEVVEGEAGALFFELVGDEVGEFGVAEEGALGDLEDEAVEGEVAVLGGGADVAGKGAVGELSEGDVGCEGEVRGDDGGGGEGGAEEVAGELADEVGLFGEGDELVGVDDAALGMTPAGEDFEAGELAGAQLDHGLEVGDDLVAVEGAAEVELSFVSHGRRHGLLSLSEESYAVGGDFRYGFVTFNAMVRGTIGIVL